MQRPSIPYIPHLAERNAEKASLLKMKKEVKKSKRRTLIGTAVAILVGLTIYFT